MKHLCRWLCSLLVLVAATVVTPSSFLRAQEQNPQIIIDPWMVVGKMKSDQGEGYFQVGPFEGMEACYEFLGSEEFHTSLHLFMAQVKKDVPDAVFYIPLCLAMANTGA